MLKIHIQFAAYQDTQVLFCRPAPQLVVPHSSIYLCLTWGILISGKFLWFRSSSWGWDNPILLTSVIFAYWLYPKNSSLQVNKINFKSHSLFPNQLLKSDFNNLYSPRLLPVPQEASPFYSCSLTLSCGNSQVPKWSDCHQFHLWLKLLLLRPALQDKLYLFGLKKVCFSHLKSEEWAFQPLISICLIDLTLLIRVCKFLAWEQYP